MKQSLLSDLLAAIVAGIPFFVAVSLALEVAKLFANSWMLAVILFPFFFVAGVFAVRLFLPPLKKGVYPIGWNRGFIAWYLHSMLNRSIRIFSLHYMIYSFGLLRYLYLKALGARVALSTSMAQSVYLHDAPMVQIDPGAMIAENVVISGHLIQGDRVLVGPVFIGKEVFIGRNCFVGPRSRLYDKAWVGMENRIAGDSLPANSRVNNFEWQRGNPAKGQTK